MLATVLSCLSGGSSDHPGITKKCALRSRRRGPSTLAHPRGNPVEIHVWITSESRESSDAHAPPARSVELQSADAWTIAGLWSSLLAAVFATETSPPLSISGRISISPILQLNHLVSRPSKRAGLSLDCMVMTFSPFCRTRFFKLTRPADRTEWTGFPFRDISSLSFPENGARLAAKVTLAFSMGEKISSVHRRPSAPDQR